MGNDTSSSTARTWGDFGRNIGGGEPWVAIACCCGGVPRRSGQELRRGRPEENSQAVLRGNVAGIDTGGRKRCGRR